MTADRFVRLCPTHRTTLKTDGDGFACSRCGGRIGRWVIHDLQKDKDVEEGTDEAFLKAKRTPSVAPALDFEFSDKKPRPHSQVVVALAKLADTRGTVIMDVRLLHRGHQPAFLIDWTEHAPGKAKAEIRDRGRAWTGLSLEQAKQAFVVVVQQALADGWLLAPRRFGTGRAVPTRPVPPPPGARAAEPPQPSPKAPRGAQRRKAA